MNAAQAPISRMVETTAAPLSVADRWSQLDGLRGVAALMILAFHSFQFIVHAPVISHLLRFGWSGVDLFFVLSGFLIGNQLQRNKAKPKYFSSFYLKRICRICPLYFLCIAGAFICMRSMQVVCSIPVWGYLFFLQNFWRWQSHLGTPFLGPTWSLAIEENFYFVMPFLVRYLNKVNLIRICVIVTLLLPCLRALVCFTHPAPELAIDMLRPDGLFLGVLAAFLVSSNKVDLLFRRRASLALFGVVSVGVVAVIVFNQKSFGTFLFKGCLGYSAVALFYTYILLFTFHKPTGIVARSLQISPLKKLAKVSYGVYLLQNPIVSLGQVLTVDLFHWDPYFSPWFMLLSAALVILAAQFSWRFLEAPFISFARRKAA